MWGLNSSLCRKKWLFGVKRKTYEETLCLHGADTVTRIRRPS
ncbi:hypothetical protein AB7M18_000644 [Pseudomonas viridiflava]